MGFVDGLSGILADLRAHQLSQSMRATSYPEFSSRTRQEAGQAWVATKKRTLSAKDYKKFKSALQADLNNANWRHEQSQVAYLEALIKYADSLD